MTNSSNTYPDENTRRFDDDCVEGDTVSEGDTSDEEDIEAAKTRNATRRTSSLRRKEGLELPSGSADHSGAKKRKLGYVTLAIVAAVAITAAAGFGIYQLTKPSDSSSPSTALEKEFVADSPITVPANPDTDIIPSTVEDENDSVPDSDGAVEDENDTVPDSDGAVEDENDTVPDSDGAVEDENDTVPDSNGSVEGKNDTVPDLDSAVEDENDTMPDSDSAVEGKNDAVPDSDGDSIPKGDSLGLLEEDILANEDNRKPSKKEQSNWPSLEGMTGEEAKAQLELEYGTDKYDIYILHEDSPTTRDYRFNRIRIFVNDEGRVSRIPRIG